MTEPIYYGALVDGDRVLLLPGERLLCPRVKAFPLPMVAPLVTAVAEQYGLPVSVLRCIFPVAENFADEPPFRVYALELRDPAVALPSGARWGSTNELEPELRGILSEYVNRAPSPLEVEWTKPGWFAETSAWIGQQVVLTGPVEQVKTWQASCILRAPTAEGMLYLKATPPISPVETPIQVALHDWYPGLVPHVVAADLERLWLLMRDFDGVLLGNTRDVARASEALRAYAAMQVDCVEQVPGLVALGCPDRRLPVLVQHLEEMCARPEPLLGEGGVTAQELQQLQGLAPRLTQACVELEAMGIPGTLEHGDFHAWNAVAKHAGGALFFDWSDACIAHPFFSLCPFLGFLEEDGWPDFAVSREQMKQAYLEAWQGYGSPDALSAAFELAVKLAPLHMAMGFYKYVLPGLERPETWRGGQTFWLRKLLEDWSG